MENEKKTVAFKTIFKYYWMQVRKYKLSFFGVFVFYGIGVIAASVVTPTIYQRIIDTITLPPVAVSAEGVLMHLVLMLGFIP